MKCRTWPGLFAVSAVVSTVVGAGCYWINVLMGWGVGTLVLLCLREPRMSGNVSAVLTLIMGLAVMVAAVMGAEEAFPEDHTFPFVSAVMLMLLWRALCGEERTPPAVANILGMILLPILCVVVFFGLKDVVWAENITGRTDWREIIVGVASVCPWWCLKEEKMDGRAWAWYGTAVAVGVGTCLLTRGVLGTALVEYDPFPMYRAVQALRIVGVPQRMEALFAAAVLMGAFALMLLSGWKMRTAAEILWGEVSRKKFGGVLAGVVFTAELVARGATAKLLGMATTIFWVMIPILTLSLVVFGKRRKNEENT